MYDLHRLRLLRELRHRGTLAAVAQALSYNPSSVSHQLAILEREAGAPLLEPAGRGVRLTPAAEVLVDHTENILRELEIAEADVAALRSSVAGTVRIATFQTAAHALLPDVVALMAERHPEVRASFAHVRAEAALPALMARDYDLVLHETYPGEPAVPLNGVTNVPILTDPLVLAVPVGSAAELAAVAEAPWAIEPAGTPARRWAVAHCRAAGFEPRIVFESTDVLLHARLVARGLAVALLPMLAVGDDPPHEVRETGLSRTIHLAWRTGSETAPAIAATRSALRDVAEQS